MRGNAHLTAGCIAGTIVAAEVIKNNSLASGFLVMASALGSLLPDIDHPESTLGSKYKSISEFINKIFGHRGVTHSIFFLIPSSVLAYTCRNNIYLLSIFLGLSVGIASHLYTDSMTIGGISLLGPLSSKRVRFTRIKSGEHDGLLLVIALVMGVGVWHIIKFIAPGVIESLGLNVQITGFFERV